MSAVAAAARTWPAARAGCALTVLGMMVDTVFWRTALHHALWGHLASVALSAVILGVLVVGRDRLADRVVAALLLLNIAGALAALSVSDDLLAHSSLPWTPFEAQRLGALTVALLAPPLVWVGVVAIAALGVVPLVEWATWSPAVRARLPPASPTLVVAYALFAGLLYAHRLARQAADRRAARAEAEAAALERLARVILSVRDLANTPLQTIELTTALARRRGGLDAHLLDRLERATRRLVAIGRALEQHQAELATSAPSPGRRRTGWRRS